MCFSLESSWGASAVLSCIGIASLQKVKEQSQLLLAGIPLLFAIQQFFEGLVWLSLKNDAYTLFLQPATYVFLFFALILWPIYVPFSLLLIEKKFIRRKILFIFLGTGIVVAICLLYFLFTKDVRVEIHNSHIHYQLEFSKRFIAVMGVFYFISTVISIFISSVKKMIFLGAAILAALIISKIFFHNYIISVWCFFAALISIMIYFILRNQFSKYK